MSLTAPLTRSGERPAPVLGSWEFEQTVGPWGQESSGSGYLGVEDEPSRKGGSRGDQNPAVENQTATKAM